MNTSIKFQLRNSTVSACFILLILAVFAYTGLASSDIAFEQFAAIPSISTAMPTEDATVAMDAVAEEDSVDLPEVPPEPEVDPSPTSEDSEIYMPPPLDSTGVITNRVTISLDKVPIDDVIKMFTRISHANIVSTVDSTKLVTVSMYDVPWKDALTIILDSADLVLLEKSPDIYTIISKKDLAEEPMISDFYQLKFLTSGDILPAAKSMLMTSNSAVIASAGNTLVITETIDQIARIKTMLTSLDKPIPQVFIEAKFLEISEQAIKDLGINWQVLEGLTVTAGNLNMGYEHQRITDAGRSDLDQMYDRRGNSDRLRELYDINGRQYEEMEQQVGSSLTGSEPKLVPTRTIEDTIDIGRNITSDIAKTATKTISQAQTALLSVDQFSLTLSALKQNTGVDIISNPKIIVASGETSTIHVGRKDPEVMAVADSNLGGRLTYQRKGWIESGVRLEVTPTVNTEDNITIDIAPTLSRVIGHAASGDIHTEIPILSTREIKTKFNIKSGMTAAIGGLTETRNQETIKKIPLLGNIPILGKYLFSHTHTERVQDEVVIFVTVTRATADVMEPNAGVPSEGKLTDKYIDNQKQDNS